MAITFNWAGYNSLTGNEGWNLNILSTNVFGFYGATSGTPIQVGQYNTTMHIREGVQSDADACGVNGNSHLTGLGYGGSNTTVCIDGGDPSSHLDDIAETDCIQISVISESNVTILASRLYAYNATNVDTPPSNLDFKAFCTTANNVWQTCGGRNAALSCGSSLTAASTHLYYVGMTIKPISTGASTLFVVRFEADIQ